MGSILSLLNEWIGGNLKSCAVAAGNEREESHWDGRAELIVGSHLGR